MPKWPGRLKDRACTSCKTFRCIPCAPYRKGLIVILAIPSVFRAFCGLLSCMDENIVGSSGTRRSGTIAIERLHAAVAAEADEAAIIASA